ncbi:MAG: ABC transporter substrate-binding protein [Actinomycetota bacterium]
MKPFPRIVALSVVMSVALAVCSGGAERAGDSPEPGDVTRGGVYRTAIEGFGFTNGFDPTGEYLPSAWGLYSGLLLRTLVTYKHIAGTAGNEIVPDIASSWETSADGLTWTFHLQRGVKFGPPLERDVISRDFAYALQRINTKALRAQYGNYYVGTIEGMTGRAKSPAEPLSGIETPDDYTIVFHLTRPTGDLLNRLAMPATAAMPEEVAGCFTKAGDYGRYLIATGPYMIQGQDQLDITSCETLEPISGYDPDTRMVLVRNTSYDEATDSPEVRSANVDGVTITVNSNTDDIFNKIEKGELDGSWVSNPTGGTLSQYLTNRDLKDNIHADPEDTTYYITMNMIVPPFDDIHVRKAVNYVIDKAAILKAWGGEFRAAVATTVEPVNLLPELADYDPYPTPNYEGDVNAALDEMRQSKYDSDADGRCDRDVCNDLLMISRNVLPWTDIDQIIVEDLSEIGINVELVEVDPDTAYTTIRTTENLVPIAANAKWRKDYADPYGFEFLIFNSAGITCQGSFNYANLGMTEDQAKECGGDVLDAWTAATHNGRNPVPSIDERMHECYVLSGEERTICWVELDRYVMEEMVPWVPYLEGKQVTIVADTVTRFEFDQFSGYVSFVHLAVNNGLSVEEVPAG